MLYNFYLMIPFNRPNDFNVVLCFLVNTFLFPFLAIISKTKTNKSVKEFFNLSIPHAPEILTFNFETLYNSEPYFL